MENLIPRGGLLGCREVGRGMKVYWGYIAGHRFNLQELTTLGGGRTDYTMYLDGNTEAAYFTAEPEWRAKQLILDLAETGEERVVYTRCQKHQVTFKGTVCPMCEEEG